MGRLGYSVGSTLLLFGAFAIGGVLHAVFVEGTLAVTSPVAVFGIPLGILLIAVGYRLERANEDAVLLDVGGETDEAEPTEDADEFDEEMAPFDPEELDAKYERDEDA